MKLRETYFKSYQETHLFLSLVIWSELLVMWFPSKYKANMIFSFSTGCLVTILMFVFYFVLIISYIPPYYPKEIRKYVHKNPPEKWREVMEDEHFEGGEKEVKLDQFDS